MLKLGKILLVCEDCSSLVGCGGTCEVSGRVGECGEQGSKSAQGCGVVLGEREAITKHETSNLNKIRDKRKSPFEMNLKKLCSCSSLKKLLITGQGQRLG